MVLIGLEDCDEYPQAKQYRLRDTEEHSHLAVLIDVQMFTNIVEP